MFADKCAFFHYTAINGIQEIMQAVAEMRLEVDRLGDVNRILMEKIND